MKKSVRAISLALAAVTVFALSACNSSTSNPTPSPTAATSSTADTGTTTADTGTTTATDYSSVGIVLPTNAESRWPMAEKQFLSLMPGATVLYSNGDSSLEKTNVESLIAQKVKVIIICPQDGKVAAAEVDEAAAAGIPVISYDRLIMGTANVSYYVTFDSEAVGAAQAQYLVDNATGTGNNLYLYAGAISDNNAFIFFQGSWGVLQPKIADGTFTIVNSKTADSLKDQATLTHDQIASIIGEITTNWDAPTAQTLAQANLAVASTAQKGTCYVLGPNDDTSRAITDAFRADSDVTKIYSTGQDFTQASLQYILDDKQSMTVWKSDQFLVQDCQQIVDAINGGTQPACIVTTYNNDSIDVPSTKADLTIVTKDNAVDCINSSGLYTLDSSNQVVPVS